jgi:hypothetical protein
MIELYDWRTPNCHEIEGAPFSAQSPATAESKILWFRQTAASLVRD